MSAWEVLVLLEVARGGRRRGNRLEFSFNLLFPRASGHSNEPKEGKSEVLLKSADLYVLREIVF